MDRMFVYDLIYALAASDGRQEALFGDFAPLARKAFCRSLPTSAFPELWFEFPLVGKPWFDLHALTSRKDFYPGATFSPENTGGCPEAFEWFAGAQGVRQLALSYDVSSGSIDHPAVQLLMARRDTDVTCDFLNAVGRPDAAISYRAFAGRLPDGWFACYMGVFPARPGMAGDPHASAGAPKPWLRVECIPSSELVRAYAEDGALLESHLRQVGFTDFGDTVIERCQMLAGMPFSFELQFDVGPDGKAGTTLGASVRFEIPPGQGGREPFDPQGAAGSLMRQLEAWGLSDERWQLISQTAFAKGLSHGGEKCRIHCIPTFVKLRWRGGEPLDAKAYLVARAVGHEPREGAR